jgi:hypothetical protein
MAKAGVNAMYRYMSDPYEADALLATRIFEAMWAARPTEKPNTEKDHTTNA